MEPGKEGDDIARHDTGREENIDRLIEETEDAIRNTRSFLEHLRASEHDARDLVDTLKDRFEKDLRILQRKNEAEP